MKFPRRWVRPHEVKFTRLLTIACLALAVLREKANSQVLSALDEVIESWDPKVRIGIRELLRFAEGRPGEDSDIGSRIGVWILWQVKGTQEPPSDQELLPATKLGALVARIGGSWEIM